MTFYAMERRRTGVERRLSQIEPPFPDRRQQERRRTHMQALIWRQLHRSR